MRYTIEIRGKVWDASAQAKRAVKTAKGIRFFHSKGYERSERDLVLELTRQKPVDHEPLNEPLICSIATVFPYRKSERKSIVGSGHLLPRDTRPDVDNITKLYLDCLVKSGWIKDDSLIWALSVSKQWGPPEKVGVSMTIYTAPSLDFLAKIKAKYDELLRGETNS